MKRRSVRTLHRQTLTSTRTSSLISIKKNMWQLLQDIARHLAVDTIVTLGQLRDLVKNTDVRSLTERMEEITEPPPGALPPASAIGT